MDIRISGHQVDTGEALKSHVRTRLDMITQKYFSRTLSGQVTFGKGPHDSGFNCDIVMHVMQGVLLKGSGRASDAHLAFDDAAERIEKQLRRHMRRLKDRHSENEGALSAQEDKIAYDARYTVFDAGTDEVEQGDAPLIIAETKVDVPTASVHDAVMMLDLRNTNALLFRHSGSGSYNMVYRRNDGTIGWVEPDMAA
ncbi:MAG: ribosome-associated translation inhibitor RaiA [Alphaproteobacteria bacterium]|nr:ribosome-associated translation inhibitor RaiA [Alphaproteobacteria bacterium]MDE2042888.1 ribosome-associated translation inhibitor RaiA [Alphaproteobacteria bacterium]